MEDKVYSGVGYVVVPSTNGRPFNFTGTSGFYPSHIYDDVNDAVEDASNGDLIVRVEVKPDTSYTLTVQKGDDEIGGG